MSDPARPTLAGMRECDDIFDALTALYDALSPEESARLNSRLILLMAAHIGDAGVVRSLIEAAARDVRSRSPR